MKLLLKRLQLFMCSESGLKLFYLLDVAFCCNSSRFLLPPAIEFATTGSNKKITVGCSLPWLGRLERCKVWRGAAGADSREWQRGGFWEEAEG